MADPLELPALPGGISVDQFRADFPQFDLTNYQDDQIALYLAQGAYMLDATRWGPMYRTGVELFAAHFLALSRYDQLAAQSGGALGVGQIVTSKSVGKVSVGYNTMIGINSAAGPWNRTLFGQQLYYYMRMFGVGAVQLTGLDGPFVQIDGLITSGWMGPRNPA